MNKKFRMLYLIIILSNLFTNCNSKDQSYAEFKKVLNELNAASDSVRIPKQPNGRYLHTYYILQDWNKQLDIKISDTGENNFQLRIWLDVHDLSLQKRLIIINYINGDFSAELIRFKDSSGSIRDPLSFIVSIKKEKKIPKSGWPSFTKKLFSDNFLLIFEKNNGYEDWGGTDGQNSCFEVITNKIYRYSEYWDIEAHDQNIKVVRVTNKIFTIVKNEFDIQSLK